MIEMALKDSFKLNERFLMKCHERNIVHGDSGLAQCPPDGMGREPFVVFFTREGLFAGRSYGNTVPNQAGGGVVIEATQAQNVHRVGA